ncbi:hypothetical protein IKG64_00685 [Candidatus Saccharibacteria bacterium]|nr:hypothetical protein [Candidatus Saccharibacteria bacterium]
MKLYISGIAGTGMGPLALMARAAGHEVCGSDLAKGAIYEELVEAGCEVYIGEQDGGFLREKLAEGVDWFAYTSALPEGHAELALAKEAGVKCTKRDDLTAYLVSELGLKMVAVAGTHGKTTTTAMIVWASLKLGLPVSYIVGTTLGFAPSGAYHSGDKYFVYEADEYDRNFLKFHPWVAVLPAVSYDHPDIYPSEEDYLAAFEQFKGQSEKVITEAAPGVEVQLAGAARRHDAGLAAAAVIEMLKEEGKWSDRGGADGSAGGNTRGDAEDNAEGGAYENSDITEVMNDFPGVGRRFERVADGAYSDYAHHPEEIEATIEVAREEAERLGKKGVVVIYEPHQNARQYKVREGYREAFTGVDKIFWLPTYLTREDPNLPVLTPEELAGGLVNEEIVELAEMSRGLKIRIKEYLEQGYLVLLMTAGPADAWFRLLLEEEN